MTQAWGLTLIACLSVACNWPIWLMLKDNAQRMIPVRAFVVQYSTVTNDFEVEGLT